MPVGRLKNMKKSTKQKIGRIVRWPIVAVGVAASFSGPTDKRVLQEIYARNAKPKPAAEIIVEKTPEFEWEKLPAKAVPFHSINLSIKYLGKTINLGRLIELEAKRFNLHPVLAEKIPNMILRESELNPRAVATIKGKTTGVGLAQVSPETWRLAKRNGVRLNDIFNPVENISAAVWALKYFDSMLAKRLKGYADLPADKRMPYLFLAYKYGPEKVIRGEYSHTDGYTEFIVGADSSQAIEMHRKGRLHELFKEFNGRKTALELTR